MNLHVIQSEEARAEAKILMRVQEHIITPRYGGSVIGGIHDHISGAYLLSNNNPFVAKPIALDVLGQIGWSGELPDESVVDGVAGYYGRELFSLIIPDGFSLRYMSRSQDEVAIEGGRVKAVHSTSVPSVLKMAVYWMQWFRHMALLPVQSSSMT